MLTLAPWLEVRRRGGVCSEVQAFFFSKEGTGDDDPGVHAFQGSEDFPFTPGVWNHFVLTMDGDGTGTFSAWLNDVLVGTTTTQVPGAGISCANAGSAIGGLPTGGCNDPGLLKTFDGLIDEVTVWGRVLTQVEIDELYLSGLAGECPVGL